MTEVQIKCKRCGSKKFNVYKYSNQAFADVILVQCKSCPRIEMLIDGGKLVQ